MDSSVKNPGVLSSGQSGTIQYDPPPSRLLQVFLFCAFLLTALAYIVGQRTDSSTERITNRMRDAKLDRMIVNNGKFLAYTKLGFKAVELKQYGLAVSNFQSAIQMQNTGEAHYNLGNALLLETRTNEALKEFQTALTLDPKLKILEKKPGH